MKPTVTVRVDKVYGREVIYPVCGRAQLFAQIAGTKTLTHYSLVAINALGFDVVAQAAS